MLQAVLDAIRGTLDPSTQIADHPNVKFAQMQRLILTEEVATLTAERDAQSQRADRGWARTEHLEAEATTLRAERDSHRAAGQEVSDAYLRIRALVNAWDTKVGGSDRFEVTERHIRDLVAEVAALRAERDAAGKVAELVAKLPRYYSPADDRGHHVLLKDVLALLTTAPIPPVVQADQEPG